jgi:hypothetical protein
MSTSVKRLGKWVSLVSKRGLSTSCIQKDAAENGVKSLNLYSAINQALYIALDTDPRLVSFIHSFSLSEFLKKYVIIAIRSRHRFPEGK